MKPWGVIYEIGCTASRKYIAAFELQMERPAWNVAHIPLMVEEVDLLWKYIDFGRPVQFGLPAVTFCFKRDLATWSARLRSLWANTRGSRILAGMKIRYRYCGWCACTRHAVTWACGRQGLVTSSGTTMPAFRWPLTPNTWDTLPFWNEYRVVLTVCSTKASVITRTRAVSGKALDQNSKAPSELRKNRQRRERVNNK